MAFTYDLASSDDDLQRIAKVRLELGDTSFGYGVKPDNTNFTDEELAVWLDEESDHVMHTVIRACDVLARLWANLANITEGPRREEFGKVTDNWVQQARTMRDVYGNPTGSGGTGSAFSVASNRVDGFSAFADETA